MHTQQSTDPVAAVVQMSQDAMSDLQDNVQASIDMANIDLQRMAKSQQMAMSQVSSFWPDYMDMMKRFTVPFGFKL